MEKVLTKKELKEKLVEFLLYLYDNYLIDDTCFDFEDYVGRYVKEMEIFKKKSKTEQKEDPTANEKALISVWEDGIAIANNRNLTRFIFSYKPKYYFSEFRDGKAWSDPVEIPII